MASDEKHFKKMKEEKKQLLNELFSAGRWTDFLLGLPTNRGAVYDFKSAGHIMSLKVAAARLNAKPDATRQYSVRGVDYDKLTAFVEATTK